MHTSHLFLLIFSKFFVQGLRAMVGAVCDRPLREMPTKCSIYGGVLVRNHFLYYKPVLPHFTQELIQHISFCTSWSTAPVMAWSPLSPVSKVCYFTSREVMEGSRGDVRIVAPGQIETIKRSSPLLLTPSPDDFLLYLTTGPLSQLSHLLL